MKPFSPVYFIKENKMRCGLLILMFVLTYISYLGGLYVTNITTMYDYNIDARRNYSIITPAETDDEYKDFEAAKKKLMKDDRVTVLTEGVVSYIQTKSIMGFYNDYTQLAFQTVEDFKTFCKATGIQCDFTNLKVGSVITSRLYADNRGMKIGDKLEEKENESVYGNYTLDAVTDEEGYFIYYIGGEGNLNLILLRDGMSEEEFIAYQDELDEEFNIQIKNRSYLKERIYRQMKGMNFIYIFIVILVAMVMAVTINAAFVGMYQHRQPEFAIYKAIGISRGRIIRKVAFELLLIDGLGIIAGGVILFLGLYLFNHLYLISHGWKLFYYHPISLLSMIICNVMVLVPLVLTRCRRLLKADICEY